MTKIEFQMLLNQYVIMAFLHLVHLQEISFMNESTFECLRKCIDSTKELLIQEAEN